MAEELPLRQAARALVVDDADRLLLVQFSANGHEWWAMPGGGIEEGESELVALRRELEEEVGLIDAELLGPIWQRVHPWPDHPRFSGQAERIYFVRCAGFDPTPRLSWEHLNAEGVVALRWWSLEELQDGDRMTDFSPSRLPALVAALLGEGLPATVIDVGV